MIMLGTDLRLDTYHQNYSREYFMINRDMTSKWLIKALKLHSRYSLDQMIELQSFS